MKNISNTLRIAVLGDGGWGTTLSIHLAKRKHSVILWSPIEEYAQILQTERKNPKFLPGITIPDNIEITPNLSEALKNAAIAVLVIPSKYIRKVLKKIKKTGFDENTIFLSASKGIENTSLMRVSEIITEILGMVKIAVISGPNIAKEVVAGLPAGAVIASDSDNTATFLQQAFRSDKFRVYTSRDITGVELGGSLKNVIAIACGMSDGMGYKSNAKSALITRGLAEISRLGKTLGAAPHTFMGLSGMGDLITTCVSPFSRNRTLGEQIGSGQTLDEAVSSTEMVVEGVDTVISAYSMAEKYKIDMPITSAVYAVLYKGKNPRDAVSELITRPLKSETA